ncbi:MAG: hypothetical protein NT026_01105 [Candidatus Staskawiczbacteria bacterium]|nr:hypothetical protein [Candidatus Staskawiczbacteria bacterium]
MNNILLFSIGLLLGMIATWMFELILLVNKKLRNRYYRHHAILFGYHVHHSTYGLLAFCLSAFLFYTNQESAIFWFSLGIGIIVVHTISAGKLVFIERYKK